MLRLELRCRSDERVRWMHKFRDEQSNSVDGVERRKVEAEAVVADSNVLVERGRALLVRRLGQLLARSLVQRLLAAWHTPRAAGSEHSQQATKHRAQLKLLALECAARRMRRPRGSRAHCCAAAGGFSDALLVALRALVC